MVTDIITQIGHLSIVRVVGEFHFAKPKPEVLEYLVSGLSVLVPGSHIDLALDTNLGSVELPVLHVITHTLLVLSDFNRDLILNFDFFFLFSQFDDVVALGQEHIRLWQGESVLACPTHLSWV